MLIRGVPRICQGRGPNDCNAAAWEGAGGAASALQRVEYFFQIQPPKVQVSRAFSTKVVTSSMRIFSIIQYIYNCIACI